MPVVTDAVYSSNSVPDIFNPVVSQISVKTAAGSQQNNSADFELSQEKSQVSNSAICFTTFQNKSDFAKEENVVQQEPSCSKDTQHFTIENIVNV